MCYTDHHATMRVHSLMSEGGAGSRDHTPPRESSALTKKPVPNDVVHHSAQIVKVTTFLGDDLKRRLVHE